MKQYNKNIDFGNTGLCEICFIQEIKLFYAWWIKPYWWKWNKLDRHMLQAAKEAKQSGVLKNIEWIFFK